MKKFFAAACLMSSIHSLPCRAADAPALPPPITAIATVLQLNDDQVKALMTMIDARDTAIRPLAMELQQHGRALDEALQSADADAATVGRLLLEARALEGKIGEIRQQAAAQFEQVLTPDQIARLQHIREAAALSEVVVPAFRAVGLV